jgi:hypothetical protein
MEERRNGGSPVADYVQDIVRPVTVRDVPQ